MVVLLRVEKVGEVWGCRESRVHATSVHEAGVHRQGAAGQHHGLEVGLVLPRQPKVVSTKKVGVRTSSGAGMVQLVDATRDWHHQAVYGGPREVEDWWADRQHYGDHL
jgi:hypothetical protein